MMPPTLKAALLTARCNDIGDCAEAIEWWPPGLLLTDAESLWERVTGREIPKPQPQISTGSVVVTTATLVDGPFAFRWAA